jgi:hypothetical protein
MTNGLLHVPAEGLKRWHVVESHVNTPPSGKAVAVIKSSACANSPAGTKTPGSGASARAGIAVNASSAAAEVSPFRNMELAIARSTLFAGI